MQNGMKEYDTSKWMTVGEAAKLLDVTPQRISMLGGEHSWGKQRVGRFIVFDRQEVVRFARARLDGLTPPKAEAPKPKKKPAPKKRTKVTVQLHVDGKKVAAAVEKHAAEAATAPAMKIRVPGIGVEIKSREGEGCAYGDVMFRRHVDGTRFSIANALRDMADVLAWTEFADADVDGGDVVVLMRLKKTA